MKGYRIFLKVTLSVAILALCLLGYKSVYDRVPGTIRLKAGVEQTLDLKIPAKGVLVGQSETAPAVMVNGAPTSNIPAGEVTIDFAKAVTVKADAIDSYQMDLKLFGLIPLKQVNIDVIQDVEVTPLGIPIGIYVKTEGILVIGVGEFQGEQGETCAPAKYLLKSGDYILQVDGKEVESKKAFMELVEKSKGEKLTLTIRRGEEEFDLNIIPQKNQDGTYKVGIWIRDNAQGVGTLTFVDNLGNFGALGHGISDVDTASLMTVKKGTLYHTDIIAIRKGSNGNPGEMTGLIEYSSDRILGEISTNSSKGIYGTCQEKMLDSIEVEPMPIGLKQDIQKGAAEILCAVSGEVKSYQVEIKEIYLDHENVNRGILLTVTDPELLELTGGIIQGMSGAPILQNGKLIGAVTHVLVQDSTSGYGIFVEEMLRAMDAEKETLKQ